jgi:hypothetical protein
VAHSRSLRRQLPISALILLLGACGGRESGTADPNLIQSTTTVAPTTTTVAPTTTTVAPTTTTVAPTTTAAAAPTLPIVACDVGEWYVCSGQGDGYFGPLWMQGAGSTNLRTEVGGDCDYEFHMHASLTIGTSSVLSSEQFEPSPLTHVRSWSGPLGESYYLTGFPLGQYDFAVLAAPSCPWTISLLNSDPDFAREE